MKEFNSEFAADKDVIRDAARSGQKISLHGGHSGEFCQHARDTLGEIVAAYARQGFSHIGLTEHIPPVSDAFRYPDETAAELSCRFLQQRFDRYIATARALQNEWRGRIRIYVGFESETYPGAFEFAETLIRKHRPDILVGSVHHVDARNFDFNKKLYGEAVRAAGDLDALYIRYFDEQHAMLQRFEPEIVAHFDLIRLHDPGYRQRLEKPAVRERIERNLDFIAAKGLFIDVNARAYAKGGTEPYPARSILDAALQRDITLVPGDDAHAVDDVGAGTTAVLALLKELYHA